MVTRSHSELPVQSPAVNGARITKGLAKVLLGTGLLLLGFVAYQLWGTALYEHSAQARLQQQLRHTLHTRGTLPSPSSTSSNLVLGSHTAPTVADPAVGNPVGLLSIPAIGMSNTAIVEGTGESQLEQGPGHYQGTPLPGEAGNAAIAGHRTTYGAPFYSLDGLKVGDAIDVQTAQGLFQYVVATTKIVDPSDVSVLAPTTLPELTLTTCNPRYSASQRLVVQALLHASLTSSDLPAATTTTTPAKGSSLPASLPGDNAVGAATGTDVAGGVVGAVLWGLGALVAAIGARLLWRRLRGPKHWVAAFAVIVALGCLLGCFQHVSQALPASF